MRRESEERVGGIPISRETEPDMATLFGLPVQVPVLKIHEE